MKDASATIENVLTSAKVGYATAGGTVTAGGWLMVTPETQALAATIAAAFGATLSVVLIVINIRREIRESRKG